MEILGYFQWHDWLALGYFLSVWFIYTHFARRGHQSNITLLSRSDRHRHLWSLESIQRETRVVDGLIVQALSSTPSFFSSTTIIIIGGLFALLGVGERANELIAALPFSHPSNVLVFNLKVLMLVAIFVYAFFRFTWSMRIYTFVSLLIGALPPHTHFENEQDEAQTYARRISKLVSHGAEALNSGIRAYYMSFAVIAWFISSFAFILVTTLVLTVLYRREFKSDVLDVFMD